MYLATSGQKLIQNMVYFISTLDIYTAKKNGAKVSETDIQYWYHYISMTAANPLNGEVENVVQVQA